LNHACDTLTDKLLGKMAARAVRKAGKRLTSVLAANLRSYRRRMQLSQEALAERCGLHRTYVGSVERAERNVTLSSLEVLARALGVSVPELLTPRSDDNK
jgi:ribosome-binding protein aMBF1 (putative translation factor)